MKATLVLPVALALVAGHAGAQTHLHAAGHADGHDHAAASGSGQAVFDEAVTGVPHAGRQPTAQADAAASVDPHAGHADASSHAQQAHLPAGHAHHEPGGAAAVHGPAPVAHHSSSDAQPIEPVPPLTATDRAAAFPVLHGNHHAHGASLNSLVRFNRFEAWDADPGAGQAWEGSAWIGGDVQRLWLRSEGEREHGRTASADLEVLYGRGISPWWDLVAGVRHDFAPGPSQSWAAFGVQGMAPYKFEVSATAYLGEHGHSAFVAEVEYELPLTARLVLQPLVEVDMRGQDDDVRRVGSGLASAEAGLRLRYEISRRFAPYLGIVHERTFGDTADYRHDAGEATRETRWVAGVRWWF